MDGGGHGGTEGGSEMGIFEGGGRRGRENWEMPTKSLNSCDGSGETTKASSNGGHSPPADLMVCLTWDLIGLRSCVPLLPCLPSTQFDTCHISQRMLTLLPHL